MSPGALAAIHYARSRRADFTFQIECGGAFGSARNVVVFCASWDNGNGRTWRSSVGIASVESLEAFLSFLPAAIARSRGIASR